MDQQTQVPSEMLAENRELRARLEEAEDLLGAIRSGDVDALVVQSPTGPQVYVLQGQDAEANRVRGDMLSQVSDAVIAVDLGQRVTYLNAAAERMYGFSASKALGRPLKDIYQTLWRHSGDEVAVVDALRDHSVWRGENIHERHDGAKLTIESGITVLRDNDGHVSGALSVMRDVTERKLQDKKLQVSEIRYRRLFEAAHDGVVIVEAGTGKIIDSNPFMTQMLGYSRDQLLGKQLFEIGLLADELASQDMMRILKQSGQVRYDNLPLVGRDGRHQEVEVIANLYDENGSSVIQCNIRDISERKRAEEHVQLLMAEVNHRARNLLAVVQAIVHQTSKSGDPVTFAMRLSDRIDGLAAGQDLLVKNHWQGVELADLVEAQLAHFKDLIGTRILVDGQPLRLTAPAAQGIGMAVHELATNAAKYGALSKPDGLIRISWRTTRSPAPTFSMSWLESGGPLVVAPKHNGFGQVVIGRMAAASVDGEVDVKFNSTGLEWRLKTPAEHALAPISSEHVL